MRLSSSFAVSLRFFSLPCDPSCRVVSRRFALTTCRTQQTLARMSERIVITNVNEQAGGRPAEAAPAVHSLQPYDLGLTTK